jgi:predicted ribosomally synthesized peptide with SipW-like signal peptide
MAKTFRTKLVLGILAAVMTLALTIGGTLMLFTAQSETATNVVTLGNAAIQLEETGDPEGDDYEVVGVDDFTGIDFGDEIVPGATLDKRPRVTNTGSVPVYVYVDGVLSVTKEGEEGVSYETLTGDVKTQIDSILATVGAGDLGNGWYATTTSPDDYGNLVGTYYLGDGTELTALASGASTSDIFRTVSIPTSVTNVLEGYTITLTLKAYAVQSGGIDETTTIDELKDLFSGI